MPILLRLPVQNIKKLFMSGHAKRAVRAGTERIPDAVENEESGRMKPKRLG